MSGIGLVVLSGIAVNNAIVLVTTVNLYRDRGMNVQDAIRDAAKSRLRPIAMTTLTTVLALLPLAIGWGDAAQLRALSHRGDRRHVFIDGLHSHRLTGNFGDGDAIPETLNARLVPGVERD